MYNVTIYMKDGSDAINLVLPQAETAQITYVVSVGAAEPKLQMTNFSKTLLLQNQWLLVKDIEISNILKVEVAIDDEITVDDIHNAANYIFAGKPVYSILATENTLKENKE